MKTAVAHTQRDGLSSAHCGHCGAPVFALGHTMLSGECGGQWAHWTNMKRGTEDKRNTSETFGAVGGVDAEELQHCLHDGVVQ